MLPVGSGGSGVCGCTWKEAGLLGKPYQFQGLAGVAVWGGAFNPRMDGCLEDHKTIRVGYLEN